MGEATRVRALEKLDTFTPKIGYPVRWRDYSTLRIDATTCSANVRAASEFEFERNLAKIGKPVDRDEWFMTPQTVNAYYNPGFNEIVFPAVDPAAALLRRPNATRPRTTAPSARSSATRSATASTTRVRSSTAPAA